MGFLKLTTDIVAANKSNSKYQGCLICGRDRSGKDIEFVGEGSDRVLILSDYIQGREDHTPKKIFSTPQYNVLWHVQGKRGIPSNLLKAAWLGYVIPCKGKPRDDKSPASVCKQRLNALIEKFKPTVIIPMGSVATQALIWDRLTGRIKNIAPSDLYGACIPDRQYNCWICPTYPPEYIASVDFMDKCPAGYFAQHLRIAFSLKDTPLPTIPNDVRTTQDSTEAASWVREITEWGEQDLLDVSPEGHHDVSIDYETTGLKPHREGHEIKAASVGYRKNGEYHAIGFKWDNNNPELIDAWYRLTHHESIGLVAHKADYEATWTKFRAGLGGAASEWPSNWSWDTCIGAHVIDNNQKVGLKLHVYRELGILGYDNSVDSILSTSMVGEDPKSANSFNLLKASIGIPWGDLIYYCAEDSLYTLVIRDKQSKSMVGLEKPFKFFMQGMDTLARVQAEGIPFDVSRIDVLSTKLQEKSAIIEKRIQECTEVAKWKSLNPGKVFNPQSPKQVGDILYRILKIKPPFGKEDCGKATLEIIGTPFCTDILELKKLAKIKDAFLYGYQREAVWDEEKGMHLIRPFFNLSTGAGGDGDAGPKTYRSSADSPNFQNIPKRDKEMKKLLRSLFIAPPGYRFMELDYKSLEVMVSASYHHDPNMIRYLQDPASDMHRDTACDMYIRKPEELTKEERNSIKSGYVFSSFYGAAYKSCALNMWNNMPSYTKEHLEKDCGIDTYDKWEEHVRKGDDIFWNKRFAVYNKWRQKEWERYQTYGYVEGFTGFRCHGPMRYTEVANRCIQGSSFHCLLWALIRDVNSIMRENLQSRIIGQIHDAIIGLVKEGEEDAFTSIIYKNGVERVSQEYAWISVPLVIEVEASAVGGVWSEMKDVGEACEYGIKDKNWQSKFAGV